MVFVVAACYLGHLKDFLIDDETPCNYCVCFVHVGITLLRDHLSNDEVLQRLSTWTEEDAPSDEVAALFSRNILKVAK